MKKVIFLMFLLSSFLSEAQVIQGIRGEFRDSVTSFTNNTDLVLKGKGTGSVSIVDSLTISGNVVNSGTGALKLHSGTTAQRPGSPANGMLRNNTTSAKIEGYEAGSWKDIITGGDVTKVGTPVDNQIAVWTGDGTLEGDADFTWDGSNFRIHALEQYSVVHQASNLYLNRGNLTTPFYITAQHNTTGGSGTEPVLALRAQNNLTSAVTTRPTLAGYNYTTKQWEVSAGGDWNFQGNDLTNIGQLGINVTPSYGLDVLSTSGFIVASDVVTDASNKSLRLAVKHYTNSEEPFGLIFGQSTSSGSIVNIGGGTSNINAANELRFFTAANTITTAGTLRANINSSGVWDFQGNNLTNIGTLGTVTSADINGGTIDGTVIGGTTPAAGVFTSVGIGTATPFVNFESVSTSAGSAQDVLQVRNASTADGTGVSIRLVSSTAAGTTGSGLVEIQTERTNVGTSGTTDLMFNLPNGGTMAERFRITGAGAVSTNGGSLTAGAGSFTSLKTTDNVHFDSPSNIFVDVDRGSSAAAGRLRFQTAGVDEVEIGLLGGGTNIFGIYDGAITERFSVNVSSGAVSTNGGSLTAGDLTIDSGAAGSGSVFGGATGGAQGAGTINAKGVYDDGVLLTDYVFEKEFTGSTIDDRWGKYNRKSLSEEIKFVEENYHLSTMIGRDQWEKKKASNGELISQLWETIETQFLYIKELEERISKLENK